MTTYRVGVPVEYRFECLECTHNGHTWMAAEEPTMHHLAIRHTEQTGHVTRVLQHGPGVTYNPERVAA